MSDKQAYIFLAEKRPSSSLGAVTLANGIAVHECLLKNNQKTTFESPSSGIIIPFIGDVVLSKTLIEEDQACFFQSGMHEISNPYPNDAILFFVVNFLQNIKIITKKIVQADVQNQKNKLIVLNEFCQIGQFQGREEAVYLPSSLSNSLFVYVICGAFEVANRLLQPHDGLVLETPEAIDFEALSDDAVLLMIEFQEMSSVT